MRKQVVGIVATGLLILPWGTLSAAEAPPRGQLKAEISKPSSKNVDSGASLSKTQKGKAVIPPMTQTEYGEEDCFFESAEPAHKAKGPGEI